MTLPRATMRSIGGGAAEGHLEGHPVATMRVRTMRLTDTEMTIGLWDGAHLVGNGLLRLADGRWAGVVTEFAGEWHCEASAGSPEIVFRETADAGAA
jgi:hypothetical protein